ncbi:hypothetical protein BHE74_00000944 [Ensete ventricosum]|nr:hypothetical protein GW17_00057216 [Ensete ventricosum]RWW89964.1 hypothetical protein BHE74_00000944 [Ensete ventricosum]RZS23443.1 hypothetical protein BHM03_00056382 [Ensete ventricosum]
MPLLSLTPQRLTLILIFLVARDRKAVFGVQRCSLIDLSASLRVRRRLLDRVLLLISAYCYCPRSGRTDNQIRPIRIRRKKPPN